MRPRWAPDGPPPSGVASASWCRPSSDSSSCMSSQAFLPGGRPAPITSREKRGSAATPGGGTGGRRPASRSWRACCAVTLRAKARRPDGHHPASPRKEGPESHWSGVSRLVEQAHARQAKADCSPHAGSMKMFVATVVAIACVGLVRAVRTGPASRGSRQRPGSRIGDCQGRAPTPSAITRARAPAIRELARSYLMHRSPPALPHRVASPLPRHPRLRGATPPPEPQAQPAGATAPA
jgi:hypothetical protein